MKKKTVAILGATGMLGNALYAYLKDRYDLVLVVRDRANLALLEEAYGGTGACRVVEFDAAQSYRDFIDRKGSLHSSFDLLIKDLGDVDYVINAIGMVIAPAAADPTMAFFVNGALPHLLARDLGPRLIHITTDCAFNGRVGFPYDERSRKTPNDIYGLSKSLGEPETCLTLRTSIIGRELHGMTGLLEWFLAQRGKTVRGFAEHYWNGITTTQFAKICDEIMSHPKQYPSTGLFHIFSNPVSKYEMLAAFNKKFSVGAEVVPNHTERLNRTLATIHPLNGLLRIPPFERMLEELPTNFLPT